MGMIKKSVTVTQEQDAWIQAEIKAGRYASDSEVIREALREKEQRNTDRAAIRARLIASEQAGFSQLGPAEILDKAQKLQDE